jgi:hypothetical protein
MKVKTFLGLEEKIARILSGYGCVPPMEQSKMIKRAVNAAYKYHIEGDCDNCKNKIDGEFQTECYECKRYWGDLWEAK